MDLDLDLDRDLHVDLDLDLDVNVTINKIWAWRQFSAHTRQETTFSVATPPDFTSLNNNSICFRVSANNCL